jgi:hypothetical protein
MSYRSITDILGETSLERKCRFLFGLCLLVLISGSFWWYGSRTEELVYTTTRSIRHDYSNGTSRVASGTGRLPINKVRHKRGAQTDQSQQ